MDSGSGGSYGVPQKRLHGHGLRLRRCFVLRWTLCLVWLMGQDPSFVGSVNWKHHPSLRKPHQGCHECCIFR